MWIKLRIFGRNIKLLLLLVLFWSPSLCFAAPAAETTEQTITMSIEQFERLKTIISSQDELLAKLAALSTEDGESLTQLLAELSEAKKSLEKTKSELKSANRSLAIADATLAKQNESLQILSEQIKRERKIHERQKWQNTILGVVAGAIIGALVAH